MSEMIPGGVPALFATAPIQDLSVRGNAVWLSRHGVDPEVATRRAIRYQFFENFMIYWAAGSYIWSWFILGASGVQTIVNAREANVGGLVVSGLWFTFGLFLLYQLKLINGAAMHHYFPEVFPNRRWWWPRRPSILARFGSDQFMNPHDRKLYKVCRVLHFFLVYLPMLILLIPFWDVFQYQFLGGR